MQMMQSKLSSSQFQTSNLASYSCGSHRSFSLGFAYGHSWFVFYCREEQCYTRFVFSQARSVSFKEMYALAVCINAIQVHLFVSLTTNLNRKHGENRNRSFPEDIGKFLIDVDECRQSVGRSMTDDYFFRRLTESYQYFYEIITLLL